jgi:hypothetical protein
MVHVRTLADADVELPPILVHRQSMHVIDGMHRIAAIRVLGGTRICAQFFDGTLQDSFLLSVKANTTHGLPLLLKDRAAAADRIIADHPDWSDRVIAATAGISAKTVAGIRRGTETNTGTTTRLGRDGRIRPLSGADGRRRVAELLRENPESSLRAVAKLAGVSPSTAWHVRNRVSRGEDPVVRSADAEYEAPATESPDRLHPSAEVMNISPVLRGLSRDPSLRFTDSGRSLLRWLHSRAVRSGEWQQVATEIPAHSTYIVADIARRCAGEWLMLADTLDERTARSA